WRMGGRGGCGEPRTDMAVAGATAPGVASPRRNSPPRPGRGGSGPGQPRGLRYSAAMSFAQVALPLPLRQTFAYRVPEPLADRVVPGVQVQVPFRGRARRGIVVALSGESPRERVLEVAAAFPPALFDAHLLAFTRWVADYYLAPWGEVLATALPGGGEGLAPRRGRRAAVEDQVLAAALPDRFTLTAEQQSAS